jgi:hypothetical protein
MMQTLLGTAASNAPFAAHRATWQEGYVMLDARLKAGGL